MLHPDISILQHYWPRNCSKHPLDHKTFLEKSMHLHLQENSIHIFLRSFTFHLSSAFQRFCAPRNRTRAAMFAFRLLECAVDVEKFGLLFDCSFRSCELLLRYFVFSRSTSDTDDSIPCCHAQAYRLPCTVVLYGRLDHVDVYHSSAFATL